MIYNNAAGDLAGTLGNTFTLDVPVTGITQSLGAQLAATPGLVLRLKTDALREPATAENVLAESKGGNANNVVMAGAHLDSVSAGPGINDNGSGSAVILEVAEQMASVKTRNKVRFALWGAEEANLVGSTFYVGEPSEEEHAKIALYLNFDMVGSPNHVFFIYDGDDSDVVGAPAGPPGSAEIEKTFERYFESQDLPYKGTDFTGRSDYGPFIATGIPSGGLFTGAEGIKTADEAAIWGGTAGVAYDPCYHQACDTFANINDQCARRERRRGRLRDAPVRDEHVRRQRREGQGQLQATDHRADHRPLGQVTARALARKLLWKPGEATRPASRQSARARRPGAFASPQPSRAASIVGARARGAGRQEGEARSLELERIRLLPARSAVDGPVLPRAAAADDPRRSTSMNAALVRSGRRSSRYTTVIRPRPATLTRRPGSC